ncbi:hypothetical protein [Dactylosporangium sp. NPDC049140]|uniref:hypothetical protein n=1 Tax=Dactylosporangium sp. NPDC049140 TaxID=3155647 RepID=UPI0033FD8E34
MNIARAGSRGHGRRPEHRQRDTGGWAARLRCFLAECRVSYPLGDGWYWLTLT